MKHRVLLFALGLFSATCFAQTGSGVWDASQYGFDTAVQKAVAAANTLDPTTNQYLPQTVILPLGHLYTTHGVDTTTSSGACVNIQGYQTSELPGGLQYTIQYAGSSGGTAIKHTNTPLPGDAHGQTLRWIAISSARPLSIQAACSGSMAIR